MDKVQAMQTFVRIAEHGSLTRAADLLGTSLPTVVRILASLEKSLGTRLFNRTTRKIALTQEGVVYLSRCKKILADIDDAEAALSDRQQEPSGQIVVTAPVLFGQLHVIPLITTYLRRYRQMQVELLLLDRVTNLIDEGIDVALRIGEQTDSSLIVRPLGQVQQIICASTDYLKRAGQPRHPKDLEQKECILMTGLSHSNKWQLRDKHKPITVTVQGKLICNHAQAAINACVNGLGLGMFLSYQVQDLVKKKKLAVVLSPYASEPHPVSIVYPHAKLLSLRVRSFVEWTLQHLRVDATFTPK